ncbi:MAG: acyltransferase [Oxalobacteraceae bacterium]|nr:MAG: acyltransferase [Oxalobacteraceae bacterium]
MPANKNIAGQDLETNHFFSIQALRGIAAIAVVLFHLGLFNIGYAGVDVFFVISGFVMGTIGHREAPGKFFFKRLIRIAPLYWIVLLMLCALSLVPNLATKFGFDAVSLVKSLLIIPYFDVNGHVAPILFIGWTLNYEMFFYVVFAIGLFFRATNAFSYSALPLLVAAGMLFPAQNALWVTYTNPLLLEFLAGMLLAQMASIRGVRMGYFVLVAGILCFALASHYNINESQNVLRVILLGILATLLVYGAVAIERAGGWPTFKPFELVGDASYSLYLWHGLVISTMTRVFPSPSLSSKLLTVLASIAFALLSFRYLEKPVTNLLRRLIVAIRRDEPKNAVAS